MKVSNMTSSRGNKIANQFIIENCVIRKHIQKNNNTIWEGTMFQSYDSNISFKSYGNDNTVFIDKTYWDYSVTTGKYRNQFLGESKKETQAKIDSGEYILTNLN